MTCPTCGRVHGCDDPNHTLQECEDIIAKLQATAHILPKEDCHICGYNPGSAACSRMHENPEAISPMHRELVDATERGDAARMALSRICDALGVIKNFNEIADGVNEPVPLDERIPLAFEEIESIKRWATVYDTWLEAGNVSAPLVTYTPMRERYASATPGLHPALCTAHMLDLQAQVRHTPVNGGTELADTDAGGRSQFEIDEDTRRSRERTEELDRETKDKPQ